MVRVRARARVRVKQVGMVAVGARVLLLQG